MWCWAPNPEASGIMGDVCDGCSDNDECMVGVLRERIVNIKSDLTDIIKVAEEQRMNRQEAEIKLKNLEKFCEEVMLVSHDRRMKLEKARGFFKNHECDALDCKGCSYRTIQEVIGFDPPLCNNVALRVKK